MKCSCYHKLMPVIVLGALSLGCDYSVPAGQPVKQSTAQASQALRVPEDETFTVEVPEGWSSVPSKPSKTKVFLLTGIEGNQPPQGMVKIDVGLPVAPTAKETAEAFAAQGTEKTVIEPAALDGAEGFEVQVDGTGLDRPQRMLVVLKEGRLYLLMAASESTVDVIPVYEQLKQSWKWKDTPTP